MNNITTITTALGEFLAIKHPIHAVNFKCIDRVLFYEPHWEDGKSESGSLILPPGPWEILDFASKLTEEQWQTVVGRSHGWFDRFMESRGYFKHRVCISELVHWIILLQLPLKYSNLLRSKRLLILWNKNPTPTMTKLAVVILVNVQMPGSITTGYRGYFKGTAFALVDCFEC